MYVLRTVHTTYGKKAPNNSGHEPTCLDGQTYEYNIKNNNNHNHITTVIITGSMVLVSPSLRMFSDHSGGYP